MTSANKVANVTFAFWIMKICATTLGETGGDMLSMTFDVGYAASSLILLSVFAVTLAAQLAASRFHPLLYWSVILSTSTAGTTMSDFLDRSAGLGYLAGSALLVSILGLVLLSWKASLGSLRVDHIANRRTEAFYWTAILASNTLGTALGDFLADSSGLGFAISAALIAGAIAVIGMAYVFTQMSRTLLFWTAFVLTRPLGATFGDVLTKSHAKGGLDLGTIGSSLVLGVTLLATVVLVWPREPRPGMAGTASA